MQRCEKKASTNKCVLKTDSSRSQRINTMLTGIPETATSRNIHIFSRFLAHGVNATAINNAIGNNTIGIVECFIAPTIDIEIGSNETECVITALDAFFIRNM